MKTFLKHKTTKKIKIMLTAFLLVSIVLIWIIIQDFLNYSIPVYYIFFIFVWLLISLVFRKDKTVKWDKNLEKVVKTTEITTILIIISIITLRKFLLPDLFEYWKLDYITTITLIITLWFFMGKLYFMWDKLKDIFCEEKTKN
jgi:amino acid transporter